MKRAVREEIVLTDGVLAVRITTDKWHHLERFIRRHYDKLHLDEDIVQRHIAPTLGRVEQGRRGLAAIDDLKVNDLRDRATVVVDTRGGRTDSVVVGKEVAWILHHRLADPAIDFASDRQERADVAL